MGPRRRITNLYFTSFPLRRIIMEEFIADEVESILYIAREISGMPHSLPHDAPVQERSSIQDPTFEGQRRSPCARVGRPFPTSMEGSYACCGEI